MLSLDIYILLFFLFNKADIKSSTYSSDKHQNNDNQFAVTSQSRCRSRLEPTVLSAEVHSKTNAITEACGLECFKLKILRKNNQQIKNQCGIRTPDGIMR